MAKSKETKSAPSTPEVSGSSPTETNPFKEYSQRLERMGITIEAEDGKPKLKYPEDWDRKTWKQETEAGIEELNLFIDKVNERVERSVTGMEDQREEFKESEKALKDCKRSQRRLFGKVKAIVRGSNYYNRASLENIPGTEIRDMAEEYINSFAEGQGFETVGHTPGFEYLGYNIDFSKNPGLASAIQSEAQEILRKKAQFVNEKPSKKDIRRERERGEKLVERTESQIENERRFLEEGEAPPKELSDLLKVIGYELKHNEETDQYELIDTKETGEVDEDTPEDDGDTSKEKLSKSEKKLKKENKKLKKRVREVEKENKELKDSNKKLQESLEQMNNRLDLLEEQMLNAKPKEDDKEIETAKQEYDEKRKNEALESVRKLFERITNNENTDNPVTESDIERYKIETTVYLARTLGIEESEAKGLIDSVILGTAGAKEEKEAAATTEAETSEKEDGDVDGASEGESEDETKTAETKEEKKEKEKETDETTTNEEDEYTRENYLRDIIRNSLEHGEEAEVLESLQMAENDRKNRGEEYVEDVSKIIQEEIYRRQLKQLLKESLEYSGTVDMKHFKDEEQRRRENNLPYIDNLEELIEEIRSSME